MPTIVVKKAEKKEPTPDEKLEIDAKASVDKELVVKEEVLEYPRIILDFTPGGVEVQIFNANDLAPGKIQRAIVPAIREARKWQQKAVQKRDQELLAEANKNG